jgi:hypothetical protein
LFTDKIKLLSSKGEQKMKVKYVYNCYDKEFTLNKEYDYKETHDGILIIDDLGDEHIIAQTNKNILYYEDDNFFRDRFIFVE